jgi:uncharacterized protein (DUF433 family)
MILAGRLVVFDRITSNPAILGGKPIVRGTRISVEVILEWIASGATRDEVLRKHPQLTPADLEQALAYAAAAVRNEVMLSSEVSA